MSSIDRWSGYGPMARHVAPAAIQLLDLVHDRTGPVVDIGSGTGAGLDAANESGIAAVGVDASLTQLTAASPGLAHAAGDASALPFRSGSFAAAISNMALIFVTDQAAAVDEVARVVRPGGRFGFSAWCADGWPDACRRVLADALYRPHVAFPTTLGEAHQAAGLLESAGFTDIEHHPGVLRWWFADLDEAVDTLTAAAGGLRVLRTELEAAGVWTEARAAVATVLAERVSPLGDDLMLDDPYLITLGHTPHS